MRTQDRYMETGERDQYRVRGERGNWHVDGTDNNGVWVDCDPGQPPFRRKADAIRCMRNLIAAKASE